MDKETLPRWGWLLLGLFAMAFVANAVNLFVLAPAGVTERYHVITVIASMAPVLIYIGIWYDDDRQQYWEHARAHILGDLTFIVVGAAMGAGIALVATEGVGLSPLLEEVVAMGVGFALAWGLFWFRNADLYRDLDRR